jgi:general secretion pathway protein H
MDIGLKGLSLRLVSNLSAIRKKDSRQAGMTGSENVGPSGHKLGTRQVSGNAGFTLLELAVVVFIIAMLAAVVFPAFFGTGNKISAEARKTASLLRYLNDNAISTKSVYPLKFNLPDGILSWQGPDGEKTETLKGLASITLTSKGTIKEGEVTVFFGPLGIKENLAVHLRGEDKDMTVSINPVSGRVKIEEGEKE